MNKKKPYTEPTPTFSAEWQTMPISTKKKAKKKKNYTSTTNYQTKTKYHQVHGAYATHIHIQRR